MNIHISRSLRIASIAATLAAWGAALPLHASAGDSEDKFIAEQCDILREEKREVVTAKIKEMTEQKEAFDKLIAARKEKETAAATTIAARFSGDDKKSISEYFEQLRNLEQNKKLSEMDRAYLKKKIIERLHKSVPLLTDNLGVGFDGATCKDKRLHEILGERASDNEKYTDELSIISTDVFGEEKQHFGICGSGTGAWRHRGHRGYRYDPVFERPLALTHAHFVFSSRSIGIETCTYTAPGAIDGRILTCATLNIVKGTINNRLVPDKGVKLPRIPYGGNIENGVTHLTNADLPICASYKAKPLPAEKQSNDDLAKTTDATRSAEAATEAQLATSLE